MSFLYILFKTGCLSRQVVAVLVEGFFDPIEVV